MTAAIIKVRLVSGNIQTDDGFSLSAASRINEQLAFMSTWELFLGFIRLHKRRNGQNYRLPDTYHNNSFLDTITRSLFMANQLNSLSTPLIANVFFLLEKYFEVEEQNNILKTQLEVIDKKRWAYQMLDDLVCFFIIGSALQPLPILSELHLCHPSPIIRYSSICFGIRAL